MSHCLPVKLSVRKIIACLFIAANFLLGFTRANAADKIGDMKCEYLINPLGIDAVHPRFTWVMFDSRHGALQTAYQLSVGTDSVALIKRVAGTWKTAKVLSGYSRVVYAGKTLQPFTKYYWQVTIWDETGKPTTSAIASFETGMVDKSNWKGTL